MAFPPRIQTQINLLGEGNDLLQKVRLDPYVLKGSCSESRLVEIISLRDCLLVIFVHPLPSFYKGLGTLEFSRSSFFTTFKDSQKVITNLKERLKELEEKLQEREVRNPS